MCIEDYEGRKPDPTPYLAAKTKMQQIVGHAIDPSDCLVVEDDPKGVQAGIAAGMKVIDRPIHHTDTAGFTIPEKRLGRLLVLRSILGTQRRLRRRKAYGRHAVR